MNEHDIDRRTFGAGVAVAAAALLRAHDAGAQTHPATPAPAPGTPALPDRAVAPLPFAPGALQGLSERLLRSHHDNNYASAVRKLNEVRHALAAADPDQAGPYWSQYGSLKGAELAARNSAVLHELYFANLAPPSSADAGVSLGRATARLVGDRFGSMERFEAQLRGAAKAASGWVVLAADASTHTLEVVQTDGHAFGAWDAVPLLVLDVYEHAYALDFGADKNAYFTAFWRNVHWSEVDRRCTQAVARL